MNLRHHYCTLKACGECGFDGKRKYIEDLRLWNTRIKEIA